MRIHIHPFVSTAALSVGLALTSIPTGALAQDAADAGPIRRWPSAAQQAAPGRTENRVAMTRDASPPSSARQQPAAGVSSIDSQMAEQRRLEQRRSPGGGGGGGGRNGGGTVRGGSPGGGAGPRVAVPRSGNRPSPGGRVNGSGGNRNRGYYGSPYYGRAFYGTPYYPLYSYSYFGPGGYYYDSYAWGGAGWGGAGWGGAGWGGPGWGGPGWGGGWGPGAYGAYGGYGLGRLRLQVSPRDAEVFIDGYYAGQVDDFDGRLQGLSLETGGYGVEIRKAGWETLTFDVRVTPGRTTTYKGELIPQKQP
jgi:hypothetical protein